MTHLTATIPYGNVGAFLHWAQRLLGALAQWYMPLNHLSKYKH